LRPETFFEPRSSKPQDGVGFERPVDESRYTAALDSLQKIRFRAVCDRKGGGTGDHFGTSLLHNLDKLRQCLKSVFWLDFFRTPFPIDAQTAHGKGQVDLHIQREGARSDK
jgi:hypothetical protein